MERTISNLVSEFAKLTPSERNDRLAKQQEEFLKVLTRDFLLKKIRRFRSLNIKDMETNEIAKAVSEVLI